MFGRLDVDDDRDELTEPELDFCESCGADADSPCLPECGCPYCRKRDALKAESEAVLVPVGIGRGEP